MKHEVVEDAQRILAIGAEAKQLGIARVFQPVANKRWSRTMGLCPRCHRPVRFVFLVEGGARCRLCAALTYRSNQMQHSRARRLAAQRPSVASGVRALEDWLKRPEQAGEEFTTAMAIFEAIEKFNPDASEPEAAQEGHRAATVKQDIEKSGTMLSQLEDAIGNTPPDSAMLPKLVNAYVALANMRDARAKVADELQHGMPTDGDELLTVERLINAAMMAHDPQYRRLMEISNTPRALR